MASEAEAAKKSMDAAKAANAVKAARTAKEDHAVAHRFWGRMAKQSGQVRVVMLILVVSAIASMVFAQLGFWRLSVIDDKPVYLMFVFAPVVMGAFLFGALAGAVLGLFAGVMVFIHALVLPIDFYEVYFMTPVNTFVVFTLTGAFAGWLFTRALRGDPEGAVRVRRLAAACLVISLVASLAVQFGVLISYGDVGSVQTIYELLLNSPAGVAVQALIDAVLMFALCLFVDGFIRKALRSESDRKLSAMFRDWMVLVSLVVFMLASGTIFTIVTFTCQMDAFRSAESELDYLQKQVASRQDNDYATLLDGYNAELDGWVVITDEKGIIQASDDHELFVPGQNVNRALGFAEDEEAEEPLIATLTKFINGEDLMVTQLTDQQGEAQLSISFMDAKACDGGYAVIVLPAAMVYRDRLGIMAASTLLAILLLIAVGLVAARVLNQVVVRRIDDTNASLEKITDGNLNERVSVYDSKEFSSLSKGINTTVTALKRSIAEVEKRNAQELATAKAIQESALPTDFPAFPDIDRFDIYASMKTAKEVGGDFYDFFEIEDTTKIGFVMADVSGKGVPAALFMMTAKAQVRTYMESGLPIEEAVNAANHQLCLGNDAGMFVTMLACELDYETGELSYVNAGHNPPLILRGGELTWMRAVSGMPLGLFDGIPYKPLAHQLEKNDVFYLYTDGVTEAMDSSGALFTEARLEETLYRCSDLNPRSLCVGVRRAITDFTLDCEQSDDITMLCLKYGVPPEEKAVMVLSATTDQLVHVCNYIHAELHRRRAPNSVVNLMDIACEELFVNICHYAYPDAMPENPGEVRISFEYEANPPALTVQLSDDGIPYNPLEKPDTVTPDNIDDVQIGGYGILMSKKSVDEMTYERVGDSNVLTFKKCW